MIERYQCCRPRYLRRAQARVLITKVGRGLLLVAALGPARARVSNARRAVTLHFRDWDCRAYAHAVLDEPLAHCTLVVRPGWRWASLLNLTGAAACTGNASLDCMDTVLSERNLTFTEVTAIPEQDTWRYDASPALPNGNFSMMCSAFVANALKVGLGAHWPALNAHEFTCWT